MSGRTRSIIGLGPRRSVSLGQGEAHVFARSILHNDANPPPQRRRTTGARETSASTAISCMTGRILVSEQDLAVAVQEPVLARSRMQSGVGEIAGSWNQPLGFALEEFQSKPLALRPTGWGRGSASCRDCVALLMPGHEIAGGRRSAIHHRVGTNCADRRGPSSTIFRPWAPSAHSAASRGNWRVCHRSGVVNHASSAEIGSRVEPELPVSSARVRRTCAGSPLQRNLILRQFSATRRHRPRCGCRRVPVQAPPPVQTSRIRAIAATGQRRWLEVCSASVPKS